MTTNGSRSISSHEITQVRPYSDLCGNVQQNATITMYDKNAVDMRYPPPSPPKKCHSKIMSLNQLMAFVFGTKNSCSSFTIGFVDIPYVV